MEKFLYLFRGGNHHKSGQSADVFKFHVEKMTQWVDGLAKKDILVNGNALERTGKQIKGTGKTVTDGPFVEAKEMVGGYVIVKAKDMNEAMEIAKGCPILESDGQLEVRQIQVV